MTATANPQNVDRSMRSDDCQTAHTSPPAAAMTTTIAAASHKRPAFSPTAPIVTSPSHHEGGQIYGLEEVPAGLAQRYARQADRDPREPGDRMRFLVLRPLRIQAWREVDELPGAYLDTRRSMDYLTRRNLLL
jgi:hypothetical protein